MQLQLLDNDRKKRLIYVKIDDLDISPFNPRRTRNPDDIDRLAKRIQTNGFEITRALWAYPNGEGYKVFAGGNRLEAVRKAQVDEIPIILHEGFTADEISRLADQDNENDEYHAPVPIVDVWMDYKRLSELPEDSQGKWTQERIADAKGVSQATVGYRMQYAAFPDTVLKNFITSDFLKEGHARELLGLSHCDNLATWLTRDSDMMEVINEVLAECAKKKKQPTAKMFKAKVDVLNKLIAEADGIYKGMEESTTLYAPDKNYEAYTYSPRQEFANALAAGKTRSLNEIRAIGSRVMDYIANNLQRYKEHVDGVAQRAAIEAEEARQSELPYLLFHSPVAKLSRHVQAGSVDVIITDPPYPKEFLPVYSELSSFAAKVLKPGGSMFVMVGQSYLPEVIARLGEKMAYHWTLAYLTPGGQATQLWQKNVNTFWKPILWYVNGEFKTNDENGDPTKWIGDVAKSAANDNDKEHHFWGQSESGMADLIERCSLPGQVIADPFLGGGTTGIVAVRMGRKFIGADSDASCVDAVLKRFEFDDN